MNRSRQESLEIVRKACVEALCAHGTRSERSLYERAFSRPIRLANVLLAAARSNRVFDLIALEIVRLWNLRKDDLTAQSDECLAFLAEQLKA